MSSITNLIVLSIFAGLFMFLIQDCQMTNNCSTSPTQSQPLFGILAGLPQNGVGGAISNLTGSIYGFMSNPINIIGTAALAIGITFYPNPWLIFLPVALFLSEWLVFPTSIFNAANLGMTDTNVQFVVTAVQAAVGVILALAFISWYKGQETI